MYLDAVDELQGDAKLQGGKEIGMHRVFVNTLH